MTHLWCISNDFKWWVGKDCFFFTLFVKFLSYFQLPNYQSINLPIYQSWLWVIFPILSFRFCWEEWFLSLQITPISIRQFSQRHDLMLSTHTIHIRTNGVTRLGKVSCRKNTQLDMTNWHTNKQLLDIMWTQPTDETHKNMYHLHTLHIHTIE